MPEIANFVADLLQARENKTKYHGWDSKLKRFFDKQFGPDFLEKYQEFKKQFGQYIDE